MSTDPTADTPQAGPGTARAPTWLVDLSAGVGLVAAFFGVLIGIDMMLELPRGCEDESMDLRCEAHPQLDSGAALVLVCIALAALIVLVTVLVKTQQQDRAES